MPRKLFVTTALPYANGPFHIGHIMEYIQADIWVRFQRMQGHEVHFVCADDTHGAAIMLNAEKLGVTPEQLIEKIGSAVTDESKAVGKTLSQPVAPVDEFSRFRAAKDLMNVTVVDALGIRSFFFTLKLERAGNLADLRGLTAAYHEAITKGSGADEAKVFTERLKALLR